MSETRDSSNSSAGNSACDTNWLSPKESASKKFQEWKHSKNAERVKKARKFGGSDKPPKKFKNEGSLFEPDIECSSIISDVTIRDTILEWTSGRQASQPKDQLSCFYLKVGAYVANLATVSTTQQFLAATLQFLAGVADKKVVDWFSRRKPTLNEGPSDVLTGVLNFVRSARGSYIELADTPLFTFMMDILGIASVCGFVQEVTVGDCTVVTREWMRARATNVLTDFPTVIMRSVEFALEVASTVIRGGSLSGFYSGRGVLFTVSKLLAREQDARSHMLEQKHGTTLSEHLCEAQSIRIALKEYVKAASGALYTIANANLGKLEQHIATIKTLVKVSGFRPRPYCFMLSGASGIGKSTMMPSLINKVGQVCSFPTDPVNIAEVTETDKYDSTISGATTTIVMDDVAQSKDMTQLYEKPHERIIRYNNTAPSMAVKPDVGEKGVIPISPRLLTLTTNNDHLHAASYMIAPEALLVSRINKSAQVLLKDYCKKPDGRIDPSLVREGESPYLVSEVNYICNNGKVTTTYEDPIDMDEWVPRMLADAKRHAVEQECLAEKHQKERSDQVCLECYRDTSKCTCTVTFDSEGLREYFNPYGAAKDRGKYLISILENLTWMSWRKDLSGKMETKFASFCTFVFWKLFSFLKLPLIMAFVSSFLSCLMVFVLDFWLGLVYSSIVIYCLHLVAFRSKKLVADAIVLEMTRLSTDFSDSLGAVALGTFLDNIVLLSVFTPILAMLRMFIFSIGFRSEGNILQTSQCNIRARREEKNEWLERPAIIPVAGSRTASTSSVDDAMHVIMKRTCRIVGPASGSDMKCTSFGLNVYSDWIVMPKHTFSRLDQRKKWDFTFDEQDFGPNRTSLIDISSVRSIQSDHVAFQVFKLNKNGDIRKYFPDFEFVPRQMTTGVLTRKLETGIDTQDVFATYKSCMVTESTPSVAGFEGPVAKETRRGDCGSPWIRKASPRIILGLHNGRAGSVAMCETIYRKDLAFMSEPTIYQMEGNQTMVEVSSSPIVHVPTCIYGEEILTSTELHPNSCMNFATKGRDGTVPLIEAYGSCKNLTYSSSKSRVVRSPLSASLEACGNPAKWGKPPMHVARNHEEVFKIAQHPLDSIHGDTMKWAKEDYCIDIIGEIQRLGYVSSPLTPEEVFNGRKSEAINPMNMKTSPGVGLTGTKADHCTCVETSTGKTYTPLPYVAAEIDRLRERARNGFRTCPITKTALKDEPTKLTKDVARIFYVMPMAFIAICREVFCPILSFMIANPIVCESWFGIRVTTNEWGQCFSHLNRFKNGKTMNGDYSKYDLHFSSQLITAVGSVFATIGYHFGYSHEDLTMVSTLFADLANPIYVFGGTLMSFLGLMPSGNPATVAINGVGNSLLHRCFFHDKWIEIYRTPPSIGTFRRYCTMGFVGDDSIGGVSDSIPWFNMKNYQIWLDGLGMPYTPADKSETMPKYVPIAEATLCKRLFVVRGDVVDSPIELDSIYKSLHMLHTVQEDPNLIVSLNVTQGLRELARWDKQTFEKQVFLIRCACEMCDLSVKDLYRTYESWREEIVTVYHGENVKKSDGQEELNLLADRELYSIME